MEAIQEQNIIDKSIDIFRGGSSILVDHRNRATKALIVGEDILKAWENAYAIEDEEQRRKVLADVDGRSQKFLVNCGSAKTAMEDARKAITQLMDEIKKMFTTEEAKLDVKKSEIPVAIQGKRNTYAKEELEYQELKRLETERKAARVKEEGEIRVFVRTTIAQRLISYLAAKKTAITNSFNAITLDSFEEKSASLRKMACVFDISKKDELIADARKPQYIRLSKAEADAITEQEIAQYDFGSFYRDYDGQIKELKQSLIDRLPAKKEELLEQKRIADEAAAERQAELERQRIAEEKRQADIAKANEAEKKRLEEEARIAREKEAERLRELQRIAEEQKAAAEAEQKRREQEEADRLAREAEEARKKTEEEAELAKASVAAAAMFEQTVEAAEAGQAPETRTGYEIKVNHPAGLVEIFQFWFQREAAKMSIDEMKKKSLGQMIAYAEAVAKKEDVKIESKYLVYETAVKAVNRKAK